MDKIERMETIKEIIHENRIRSQEQLLSELLKKGCDVTQATLSRDLKQLKVAKISDGADGYTYSIPGYSKTIQQNVVSTVFLNDLKRGFLSIVSSGNISVIKTIAGHANSVASAIDNVNIPGILGTVAGDDTIFIVLAEDAKHSDIENFFRGLK
ncbi:MAG: arginine repressor [Spirochaetales bacterium]|nr:arginine repressor [Spirochaetales bacterium]